MRSVAPWPTERKMFCEEKHTKSTRLRQDRLPLEWWGSWLPSLGWPDCYIRVEHEDSRGFTRIHADSRGFTQLTIIHAGKAVGCLPWGGPIAIWTMYEDSRGFTRIQDDLPPGRFTSRVQDRLPLESTFSRRFRRLLTTV